jgi:predicted DNA-binding transcriptional regulator YafY
MNELTQQELEVLAAGLDSLARSQKDVLRAAAELLPIRQKIETALAELKKVSEDGTSN